MSSIGGTGTHRGLAFLAVPPPEADLIVTKVCKPDQPVLVGTEAECTIFIDNFGPSSAEGVLVTDDLPAETDAVLSATFETKVKSYFFWKTKVHRCDVNGQVVICDIGALEADDTKEIVIRIRVENLPAGTDLSPNVVTVESETGELIPSDNTFMLVTTLN